MKGHFLALLLVNVALGSLHWRSIEWSYSSRVDDLAVPAIQPGENPGLARVIYIAGPAGVYKTVNAGTTWQPVFDDAPTIETSSIAVAPSNPNVVWAGTGSWSAVFTRGKGVFKSLDGGAHWQFAGLPDSISLGHIAIDPYDSNVVYVSVLGDIGHPSQTRGLYKTTDGGATWSRVLFIDDTTGVVDVAVNPIHPAIVFAAAWHFRLLYPHWEGKSFKDGIYRSMDGGHSWSKLEQGVPNGLVGRISLAISPSSPSRVYAIVDHFEGGAHPAELYRSDDNGDHWRQQLPTGGDAYGGGNFCVDPRDAGHILSMGDWLSADGGATVQRTEAEDVKAEFAIGVPAFPYHDSHACAIDPLNHDHLLVSNDHGVWQSFDDGVTWVQMPFPSGGMWWSAIPDLHTPYYRVFGAVRDYGAVTGPSRTARLDANGVRMDIRNDDWNSVPGSEDGGAAVSTFDPDDEYTSSLVPSYNVHQRIAKPWPKALPETGFCFGQMSSLVPSLHDRNVLYSGGKEIYKSDDGARTWKPISGTLVFGKTRDCIGVITESPRTRTVLYAGATNGHMFATFDSGKHWRTITVPDLPASASVWSIAASVTNARTLYAVINNAQDQDYQPYIFKSSDAGRHWTKIINGLPETAAAWNVAEDPYFPSLLFAATDGGVFVSRDGGGHWESFRADMPAIRVSHVAYQPHEHDLIASTWGRGVYITDDIIPLEHLDDAAAAANGYLFPVRPTVQAVFHPYDVEGSIAAGDNPPYGVPIDYYLPSSMRMRTWKLDVFDPKGKHIAALPTVQTPGLHRTTWDMTHVPPGRYTVRLTLGSAAIGERHFTILPDSGE